MKQKACIKKRFMRLFFLLAVTFSISCSKEKSLFPVGDTPIDSDDLNTLVRKKPNIILILADDVGYEIPACNGGQSYNTPNLDRIAQLGMRFTNFHASPLCSPSRTMLLTGKYNFRNYEAWGVLDLSEKTIGNMFKDAGYKTCIAGKWQLDGGDEAMRTFGFDDYLIWSPFTAKDGEGVRGKGSRYKNPVLYENAVFLPKSLTQGKYGEDMLESYLEDFIDSNKATPFFMYYPICLAHEPFCPPPGNADFDEWDPKSSIADVKYFPDMISYMDTKVGKLLDKVYSAGIAENTLVIFLGDNGTDGSIVSRYNNRDFRGGKSHTTEAGTKVPLLMWWQGKIQAGSENNSLIDFTDFLPTLANVANIPIPENYGILDGVSFAGALRGDVTSLRKWIYCYFDPDMHGHPSEPVSWVQDTAYKLYKETGLFYHYSNDLDEKKPLAAASLTQKEKNIKSKMELVLAKLHE